MNSNLKFIGSEIDHRKAVTELIDTSKRLWAAVAFWGDGIQLLFKNRSLEGTRLVCNLSSGGCNPKVVREIQEQFPKDVIRQIDNLHAKVVLGDVSALIGSANFSANGLGLEGSELTKWREASIYTSQPEACADLERWFEKIWAASRSITNEDLDAAQLSWNQRRVIRPLLASKLTTARKKNLADRDIHVVIWQEKASEAANASYKKFIKENVVAQGGGFDFFEDADDLPETGKIISVYLGKRGSMRIDGVYSRCPDLDRKTRTGSTLQILQKEKTLLGQSMTSKWKEDLLIQMKSNVMAAWERQLTVISIVQALHGLEVLEPDHS